MEEDYCEDCGRIIPDSPSAHLVLDRLVCEDCYADYSCCYECADIFHSDDLQDYHGNLLCEDCYADCFLTCNACGLLYDESDEDAWGDMCAACARDHFICEGCGNTLHMEVYGENGSCISCSERQKGKKEHIHDYHEGTKAGRFFYPVEDLIDTRATNLYFGVELETEGYEDVANTATELHDLSEDESLFWLEADCSLCNGFELITQPCTLDYHRDEFPWDKITAIIKHYKGRAFSGRTSALHIHFNLSFFTGTHAKLYQVRLLHIGEIFRDELLRLGRTTEYLASRSAIRCCTNIALNSPFCSSKTKLQAIRSSGQRMCAININSSKRTIELRFFRSSISVPVILAYLELADFLVRTAMKTPYETLDAMCWNDMLERIASNGYRYLPQLIIRVFADAPSFTSEGMLVDATGDEG